MIGSGETSAAQATGGHVKITPVFLYHDVGGGFGCAKERVLGLVNGKCFGDAVFVSGIVVIPAGVQFF